VVLLLLNERCACGEGNGIDSFERETRLRGKKRNEFRSTAWLEGATVSSAQPRPGSRVEPVGLGLELPRTEGRWTGELSWSALVPLTRLPAATRCGRDFFVATVATTTPAIPDIRTVTAGDLAAMASRCPAVFLFSFDPILVGVRDTGRLKRPSVTLGKQETRSDSAKPLRDLVPTCSGRRLNGQPSTRVAPVAVSSPQHR
jgi:hypothetical protein